MPRAYAIHGFHVASNIVLPAAGESVEVQRADLTFEVVDDIRDAVNAPLHDPETLYVSPFSIRGQPRVTLHRSHGLLDLRAAGCGRFLLSPQRVRLYRVPGARPAHVANAFLGSALSIWLEQRGLLALHASAVADDEGRVMAFCGASGAGKSTLAQHLVNAGLHLVTDDLLAVSVDRAGVFCQPGPPSIRLTTRSLAHFAARANLSALPGTGRSEKFHSLAPNRCRKPARLATIYFLDRSARTHRPHAVPVRSADAVMSLVRNRFVAWLCDGIDPRANLARVGETVRRVPVRRLCLPDRYEALEDLAALIHA